MELTKNRIDTSTEVRARIEHALHHRTAPLGTNAAKVERLFKSAAHRVWTQVKKRQALGVVAVGGAGIALATAVGVGELAIGIAFGYAAYQVLREGLPPGEAARKLMTELEKLA